MEDAIEIQKIEDIIKEFFDKMTIDIDNINIEVVSNKNNADEKNKGNREIIKADIKLKDPQILIGQNGQTLYEIYSVLRIILNKKMQKLFYLNLDINDYKKRKEDHIKSLARDFANEVLFTKKEKILPPMAPFERRIIHEELSKIPEISTESQGEGLNRRVIIKAK